MRPNQKKAVIGTRVKFYEDIVWRNYMKKLPAPNAYSKLNAKNPLIKNAAMYSFGKDKNISVFEKKQGDGADAILWWEYFRGAANLGGRRR